MMVYTYNLSIQEDPKELEASLDSIVRFCINDRERRGGREEGRKDRFLDSSSFH